jgi:N-acetylglucosaminyldiphosphoundecaprenol N-acetyl-beta-D-mannosaminyltransferase
MLQYCAHAASIGEAIFLYGSTPATLEALQRRLTERWPTLKIAGAIAPPFRPSTRAEDEQVIRAVNESGARTLWVGLGCPKQEFWTTAHRGAVQAVMIGVGAAFDFHAGTARRAPLWMQEHGLEWLHRFISEPRRLWKRYLVTNTVFVLGAARQLLAKR